MKKFVQELQKRKEAQASRSFAIVKDATKDRLSECMLSYFMSVANMLCPFLTKYRTDKVMIPFFGQDLDSLTKSLMMRLIKDKHIPNSKQDIVTVEVKEEENHKSLTDVGIWFLTEAKLKETYYQ